MVDNYFYTGKDSEKSLFKRYSWWDHPAIDYCGGLFARCSQSKPDCPAADCKRKVGALPMINECNLAFEYIKISKE